MKIENKCKQYVNAKDEFEFSSHYNKFKDKNFTVEHDKLLVYFAYKEGLRFYHFISLILYKML